MVDLGSDEVRVLLEKDNVDVISIVISHWHALGTDAFLYDLSHRLERKVRGLILIAPHPKDGYIISEKDFNCCDFADLKFQLVDVPHDFNPRLSKFISEYVSIFLGLRNIRSKGGTNDLYVVSPLWPYMPLLKYFEGETVSSKYNPILVLVDEGFGSYASKKVWNLVRKKDAKFCLLDLISTMSIPLENSFRKLVLRNIPLESRFLFRKEGQLKINENICSSYKEVLKLRKNDLMMDKTEKMVIIIPEPLSEYDHISVQEEFHLMESLIKFINKKGIKPILKPHPREKGDKYRDLVGCDFEIIKNDFAVEEILPFLKPICVIGYASTALLNSKVFYDINAVSLANIVLQMSNDELLNTSTEDFKNLTSNLINFVDDIEDIGPFI